MTATFGDSNWDCLPFARTKSKNTLSTVEFENHPELQRELKLITFGWLFNKNKKKKKALKFSSIAGRLSKFKIMYRFLAQNNYTSLRALSNPKVWGMFENYLQERDYTPNSIMQIIIGLNATIHSSSWHKLPLLSTSPSNLKCWRIDLVIKSCNKPW